MGAVFLGEDDSGGSVAVKRIDPAVPGSGDRELSIARDLIGKNFAHVIPILDVGRCNGTAYVVMPKADKSLHDVIAAGGISEPDAVQIVDEVAMGLIELKDYVHRDLKPKNILSLNGLWKLADFGISRVADAMTAPQTLKGWMTFQYSAPELWNHERATHASDVYALGCLLCELIEGNPPFKGPDEADFKHQHETVVPPTITASPNLQRLYWKCLSKSPELRPTVDAVRSMLERVRTASTGSVSEKLAKANAAVAAAEASAQAAKVVIETTAAWRKKLFIEGLEELNRIMKRLFESIQADADGAEIHMQNEAGTLTLGKARIDYVVWAKRPDPPQVLHGWDVLANGIISVNAPTKGALGEGIYFARSAPSEPFRWYTASFIYGSNSSSFHEGQPAYPAGKGMEGDALAAFLGTPNRLKMVAQPEAIDGAAEDEFVNKWKAIFADAAVGG